MDEQKNSLRELRKSSDAYLPRIRSHAIILSDKGYYVEQISDILDVCRQTVSNWLDKWEIDGYDSLFDKPGRGRRSKLSLTDIEEALKYVVEEPRTLKKLLRN